jgi:hypothetical protein
MFVDDTGLPVEVRLTRPSLASQFVVQTDGSWNFGQNT